MVIVKTAAEIKKLREAGRLSALALKAGGEAVVPGITTGEIDRIIHDFIVKNGATPSFLNLYGFPASACISVNDELIHGIPGNRVIQEGDIVTIDAADGCHQREPFQRYRDGNSGQSDRRHFKRRADLLRRTRIFRSS